ncbi:MAG: type II secretion system F family protein [Nanoarchaeota archaeon]|nr:type II secretion system F family protein [Nanoarchaeota archaeon]
MFLGKLALRLFGGIVKPNEEYFASLKTSLRKAGMLVSVSEYLSVVALSSLIAFIVSLLVGVFLIALTTLASIFSYTFSIIIAIGVTGGTFGFGYIYPSMQAKSIRGSIEKALPFAVFYMATTSSSGITPVQIFKMLSVRGGHIGKESQKIYTDVKALGMNLTAAMQKAASRSPSSAWADLLWGMTSVITSGGDLEEYLNAKTRTFMAQYRRTLEEYANAVSFYTEIYITLIIVGSLFFIILIAIMAPLTGGSTLLIQTFLVFFFIPIISVGFIALLRAISPVE